MIVVGGEPLNLHANLSMQMEARTRSSSDEHNTSNDDVAYWFWGIGGNYVWFSTT